MLWADYGAKSLSCTVTMCLLNMSSGRPDVLYNNISGSIRGEAFLCNLQRRHDCKDHLICIKLFCIQSLCKCHPHISVCWFTSRAVCVMKYSLALCFAIIFLGARIILLLNVARESFYYGGILIKCHHYVAYQEIRRCSGSQGGGHLNSDIIIRMPTLKRD